MDIKSFVVGTIFGAMVFVAVDRFVFMNRAEQSDELNDSESQSARSAPARDPAGKAGSLREASSDAVGPSNDAGAATEQDRPPTLQQGRPPMSPTSDVSRRPSGENEPRDVSYWLDKRREELEAEPKDDSWAYYMEQTIVQFLANHPLISAFDISYVECRTITCQIQVVGFDDSTNPTWQRIMYDLGRQLPDGSRELASSSFDDEGRLVIVQTIRKNERSP